MGNSTTRYHGMVRATGVFVEYKCYDTSGEVEKAVK